MAYQFTEIAKKPLSEAEQALKAWGVKYKKSGTAQFTYGEIWIFQERVLPGFLIYLRSPWAAASIAAKTS